VSVKDEEYFKNNHKNNLVTGNNGKLTSTNNQEGSQQSAQIEIHPELIEYAKRQKENGTKSKMSKRDSMFYKPTEKDNEKMNKLLFKVGNDD
jgi:formylmethanofuran dehydrogenase subunit E